MSWVHMTQSATGSRLELTEALNSGWQTFDNITADFTANNFFETWHVHFKLLKPLMARILKRYIWQQKNGNCQRKNQTNLDEQEWERQTTKLIAYNFGMLLNDGKKIGFLRNGFKICRT